jgi:hypothetical protein
MRGAEMRRCRATFDSALNIEYCCRAPPPLPSFRQLRYFRFRLGAIFFAAEAMFFDA